jgi:hypothetical protein
MLAGKQVIRRGLSAASDGRNLSGLGSEHGRGRASILLSGLTACGARTHHRMAERYQWDDLATTHPDLRSGMSSRTRASIPRAKIELADT